jgi:hypothetical protein
MAKGEQAGFLGRLAVLSTFSAAMGYLEAMVVVYLRRIMPIADWNRQVTDYGSLVAFLEKHQVMWTEQTREAATIIMLIAVALLAGSTVRQKFGAFLWSFATWDLFYYISLYLLIKWPPSLATWDVLFLIPKPWVSPVYIPVIISLGMLMVGFFLLKSEGGRAKKSPKGGK